MRVGCVTDASGANVPAPAEDVDNENPSLVALGKNGQKVVKRLFKKCFLANREQKKQNHSRTTFSRERRAKGSRLVGLQPGPGRSPRTASVRNQN